MDEPASFSIELTDDAFVALTLIASDRIYDQVKNDIRLLETSLFLGQKYDPVYPASVPSFECRVLYCWHYGIYHVVDEEKGKVTVFTIEDHRRNPESRFKRLDYAVLELPSEE